MRTKTASRVILWMEHEGDIYSPERRLVDANEESIADDIWNGEHVGVCHSIYAYGAYDNGGSWCGDVTARIAERLSRRSLDIGREPPETARRFLDREGFAYHEGDVYREVPARARPPMPAAAGMPPGKKKRRRKPPSPEQIREQPQFKLPIAGGKTDVAVPRHEREKKAS